MSELNKKVQQSIKIIKIAEQAMLEKPHNDVIINKLMGGGASETKIDGNSVEVSYSTGKDSDVILYLCRMAGIKNIPIYKHTSIDPPHSIDHAKDVGAVIIKPKQSFFSLIENRGFPTRRARFCCQVLKEYKILDVAIQGIRTSESRTRAERYKMPQICRMYNKKDYVQVFLPILNWTNDDVEEFIKQENIQCHPHYYDEKGKFHVEKRVGCLCCPLQSNGKCKRDFIKHPKFVRAYIKHGRIWWNNHPNTRSHVNFTCVEDLFYHNVFCDSYQDYLYKTTGMFGRLDTKSFLEDFFKINL